MFWIGDFERRDNVATLIVGGVVIFMPVYISRVSYYVPMFKYWYHGNVDLPSVILTLLQLFPSRN